jgi:hypothetical protein
MFVKRLFCIAVLASLGACASPGDPSANRHQHLRDAKQGPAMSATQSTSSSPKLLHDHREMK